MAKVQFTIGTASPDEIRSLLDRYVDVDDSDDAIDELVETATEGGVIKVSQLTREERDAMRSELRQAGAVIVVEEEAPTRRRLPWRLFLTVAGLVVVVAAGVVMVITLTSSGSSKHQLTGSVSVVSYSDSGTTSSDDGCSPGGGYSDISDGASVVITNEKSSTIAVGELSGGKKEAVGICELTWTATVPNADFYTVTIGHRGGVTYSRDDMSKRGWDVHESIGDGT